MLEIQLAKISELEIVEEIARACAKDMIKKNIFQWNEYYPSKNVFKNDIENQDLYVGSINSKVISCIMFSSFKDEVYKDVKWLKSDSKNLYIHRLAVHPAFQKKGFASKMMNFAENYAKINNFNSIRLDTFSQNPRNNKFYKSRNYIKLGDVYFPKQSSFPFHCYEKLIT
ncbi:MAG: GNAT family N-acetyltransferase [Bacteroidota bacterium]